MGHCVGHHDILMIRSTLRLLFLIFALCPPLLAQPAANSTHRPKLVVLVVVDQMRGDYLPRFERDLAPDGFARLMKEGADFRSAYLSYGCSATGPGHATISTGRIPRQHGIPGNEWYLEPGSNKPQLPIADPNCKMLGVDETQPSGLSPVHLIGPGFGDALKLADVRSRVFSVGLKDRSSIFLGGKNPNGAFWWDAKTGHFVSSTYYMEYLPEYVTAFNNERWADRYVGKQWTRLLDESAYADCHINDPSWITDDDGLGPAFPHALPAVKAKPDRTFYSAIYSTPFGNEVLMEMARRVLMSEKLGKGPAVDLLCIAMSANDVAGHIFGPESAEMKDFTLRTDRKLAAFMSLLDVQVGKGEWMLALTADHGVKSIPELSKQARLGGGRVDAREVIQELEAMLVHQFGKPPMGPRYVAGIEWPWIYLDRTLERMDSAAREHLIEAAALHLRGVAGVDAVYTAKDMSSSAPSNDEWEKLLAWRSYNSKTCGELYIQLSPYWHTVGDKVTGHGTSHTHDRHVPILLYGPGVRPGAYFTPADTIDISVTLSALIGIEKPVDAMGRVLYEAMQN